MVVFVATRRENVVVADTLVYPSHQVRALFVSEDGGLLTVGLGRGWCAASQVVMESFCGWSLLVGVWQMSRDLRCQIPNAFIENL